MLTAAAIVLAQVIFSGGSAVAIAPPCAGNPPPCSPGLPAGTVCVTLMPDPAPGAPLQPCGPDIMPGWPCLWTGAHEIILRSRTGHGSRASVIFGSFPPFPGSAPPHVRGGYVHVRLDVGPNDCGVMGAYRDVFEGAIGLGQAPCWE